MKMSVGVLDHYNVSTRKLDETVHFYETVLGFTNGPRPPFNFPGAWLYSSGHPVLHVNDISQTEKQQHTDFRVSSIMSLSAAAASRQRSGISPKRESRTTWTRCPIAPVGRYFCAIPTTSRSSSISRVRTKPGH